MKTFLVATLTLVAGTVQAQPTDSLRLETIRAATRANDPRAAQLELLASQSALRLKNISSDLKPAFLLDGIAQYQSDVPSFSANIPGISLPTAPNDTYDARLNARQRIYDPAIAPRRTVERAQLAESQARVRTAMYSLNESANLAFFTALRSQTAIAELETSLQDITEQQAVAARRIREGVALPSEANALIAEILRRRQVIAEHDAARKAGLAILSDLTGRQLDPQTPVAIPDLRGATNSAQIRRAEVRSRPEFEQFARSRDALDATSKATRAQDKPRVSAFGRVGYGKPALKFLSDEFDSYWLGGIQLEWSPWTWGASSRARQLAELQKRVIDTEEKSFSDQLTRAIEHDVATIDRLENALIEDETIIELREKILTEARARFRESVITSAEFVDRQTDVLSARLNRAIHRVELAQAQAHLLTTLGVEVR